MVDLVGVGSVLGGLGGLFGSRRSRTDHPQVQAYETLKGAFNAADEAGIHRLAVAGSPAGYSPVPRSSGEGIMAAGRAIRDYGIHRQNKKTRAKEDALIDAQIEEARSRTVLNNANARRAMMGPQPNLGQPSNIVQDAFDSLSNGGKRQISREPERDQPATQTVTLGDGNTGRGPNPEAFEVGLSELAAGMLIYGPQVGGQMLEDALDAHNRNMAANQPPRKPDFPKNPSLGQVHRQGKWEWQFTRGGWRRRGRRKP